MAYPEPIPALRGPTAKRFIRQLENFRVSGAQRKLYKGARELYRKIRPRE